MKRLNPFFYHEPRSINWPHLGVWLAASTLCAGVWAGVYELIHHAIKGAW